MQHRNICCGGSCNVASMIREGAATEYQVRGIKMLSFIENIAGQKEANIDEADATKATLALHVRTFS
jgi:hypothetical protein